MYQQFNSARRQPKAVAVAMMPPQSASSAQSAGVIEMVILSLVGLAAALFVIAHGAGSDLLAQMFAP